jgi:NADPH:quinone reductase
MSSARKWVAVAFGGPEVLRNIEVELPDPAPGQVRIGVRASGMNPADAKHIAPGQDPGLLPLSIGYEVAGVVTALGPDTELASGGGAPGDEVLAQVTGGYTTAITTSASDAFAKPPALTFPEAANLLLVGTTAADLLRTSGAGNGETVLLHGAAGAVGMSVLQQARILGVQVVGRPAPRTSASSGASAGSPSPTGRACSAGSGPPARGALPLRWTRWAATRPATPR